MPEEGELHSQDRRVAPRDGLGSRVQDAAYRAIRHIVGRTRSLPGALGLFLGLSLLLSAAALGLFAWVATEVVGGATQRFDQAVVDLMRANAAPVWDWLGLAGAALGSWVAVAAALVLGTFFLWRSRHHFSVLLLWVSLLGGRVLNHELKVTFGRPRPQPVDWDFSVLGHDLPFPGSYSFPSGHATTAMVVFGTLAYLAVRLEPTRRQRRWTLAAATALILLIGWSRIYLGVHYPSDVLAGYLSGFAWIVLVALAIEVIRHFAARQPEVAEEERDIEKGLEPVREALRSEEP